MRALILTALLVAPAGCLGRSPEQEQRDGLGVGDDCEALGDDEGPEHCAGEPCLACHDEDYHPGEAVFLLAGTVYDLPGDRTGRAGGTISFVDADLRPFTVTSNRTGNFMVSVGEGGRLRENDRGRTTLPFRPRFPIGVGVIAPEGGRNMRSFVWRQGSCAACHLHEEGTESAGAVFVREPE